MSITVESRSATSVMPTGACQPPICRVCTPSESTTMTMMAESVMVASSAMKAMVRWIIGCREKTSASAAASAGIRIGRGIR